MDFQLMTQGLGEFIELIGVFVIVGGVVYATISFLSTSLRDQDSHTQYRAFKINLGRAILLGLEILVAGDIIRSVGTTPTLEKVLILGMLVLIRTFLGVVFEMEVEGRWPWVRNKQSSEKSL